MERHKGIVQIGIGCLVAGGLVGWHLVCRARAALTQKAAAYEQREEVASSHPVGPPFVPVAHLEYTGEEDWTWGAFCGLMDDKIAEYGHSAYLVALSGIELGRDAVPQLADVNVQLAEAGSAWRMHPVGGLVDEVEFFALLGSMNFPCGVHIRDASSLTFADSPDLCHEVFGHLPWFFVPQVARLTARFGAAYATAQAAGDSEMTTAIKRVYFWTLEVGLVKEDNSDDVKVLGSGMLSSVYEIERSVTSTDLHIPFDIDQMVKDPIDVTIAQPHYYVVDSLDVLESQCNAWLDQTLSALE